MKKFVSVLLVFAAVASLMSVCGFATDADMANSVNDFLGEIANAYDDFADAIVADFNCGVDDLLYDVGLSDFFADVDAFLDSIFAGFVELVAKAANIF